MAGLSDYPRIEFRSRNAIRDWFETNYESDSGFWLITCKKHVAENYIPYGEIVEELLCFGWVDSRTRRVDNDRTMLLVAPRKTGSTWSASNKRRVAELARQGLMKPAGQAKIDMARKDGSWVFLDDIENLFEPADLVEALAKNKRARKHFDGFNASAKKVILLWIKTAKRKETRRTRIKETARLAALNIKAAHPEARGR